METKYFLIKKYLYLTRLFIYMEIVMLVLIYLRHPHIIINITVLFAVFIIMCLLVVYAKRNDCYLIDSVSIRLMSHDKETLSLKWIEIECIYIFMTKYVKLKSGKTVPLYWIDKKDIKKLFPKNIKIVDVVP